MVKLGQVLALVLGGLVLKLVGFDGNAASNCRNSLQLRIADIFIPSITAGLAIIIMWKYSLSEKELAKLKFN